jgi:general secretion pathway protein G
MSAHAKARKDFGPWHGAHPTSGGYHLIELMLVLAIMSTLAAIAIPTFQAFLHKTRIARAIADIRVMSTGIEAHKIAKDGLPASLTEVGYGDRRDPWGNLYQYLNIETQKGVGKARKDQFLVPLNSDYDLYSMGRDGTSQSPLKAKASRDDILRANNGGYVGLAELF